VARELERAHRTGAALVLAFVGVIGLRQVNDSQGQLAGDALLRLVGETVRANLRPYDVVLRYGGDELVGAMPHIGATECRERFERITAALTAADAEHSVRFGLAEADPAAVSESSSRAPAPTCSKPAAPVGARQARRPR
jgi:diguanylate cyclase (GGDEF)-like protein